VVAHVQNDPAISLALLSEAITQFVNGEPEPAKLILPDLDNATVGVETLAGEIQERAEGLHRMSSKPGNPTMTNVPAIFAAIKRALKVIEKRPASRQGVLPSAAATRAGRVPCGNILYRV